MNRLAPEPAASAAFVEVIERVDELRRQNSPIEMLLLQMKGRLLKEKVTRMQATLRGLLPSVDNETDEIAILSRMSLLNQLERELPSCETLDDLAALKRKIEDAMS